MITRGKSKKRTEDTDEEEMEMIEEMIEEDAQGDQPENLTQSEPEVEVIVGDQTNKLTQEEDMSMQDLMNFLAKKKTDNGN